MQVVRRPNLSNEQSKTSLTLAEKAREMRSREEEEKTIKGRRFETLASRAQRKRSPSPEAARQEGRKAGGPVFSRLGPKF